MCFDYLYILGLTQNEDLANYVMEKDVFTDLMFKREKELVVKLDRVHYIST